MRDVDQRQAQQQADWRSIPGEGVAAPFMGDELTILPGVFPPRRDTRLLTESVDISQARSVLDVGTGSGALAIWASKRSNASVVAVDISEMACRNTRLNVENLGLNKQIQVRVGGIDSCLHPGETFDVIIANLPGRNKKATDPVSAAQWDTDFQAHEELFHQSKTCLRKRGTIYMVKANYPDLLEMLDLAESYGLRAEIRGKSEATADDPRVYYALSLTKLEKHGR